MLNQAFVSDKKPATALKADLMADTMYMEPTKQRGEWLRAEQDDNLVSPLSSDGSTMGSTNIIPSPPPYTPELQPLRYTGQSVGTTQTSLAQGRHAETEKHLAIGYVITNNASYH